MQVTIQSGEIKMKLRGKNIQELIKRFMHYSFLTDQEIKEPIEIIKIK